MTHQTKTTDFTMHQHDEDVERGNMWSTGHSHTDLPWQRSYAAGTPLPGSPQRNRSLDNPAESSGDEHSGHKILLTLKQRVRHFVWTWFTMTMATGQLANVILAVPYDFHGRYAIGCCFFIFNLVLFTFNVTMISLRFYWYPSTFKASFTHPTESLFVPASVVSCGTVLTNITEFAVGNGRSGYWLERTMIVLFWVYCGMALSFTCGIYLIMWSTQTYTISRMTPVWIFPAYPLLIIGPHAGRLSARVAKESALPIIVGGFCLQGIGFMMSLMVYSAFLYRLMTQKLPKESLRPGMFISVGPSGFTIAGVINMAQNLPACIPENFMGVGEMAGTISVVMANWMGIWLWGLAIFFFIVSCGAHWSCVRHGRLRFALTWYSFIFPNTGLTNATFAVAKALDHCRPIRIFGCVLTCLLVAGWFFVFGMMIRAVILKDILWPQKQEDRDEGGWKTEELDLTLSKTQTQTENPYPQRAAERHAGLQV
ncbi:putative C4-dicarboxylate/malic acid transporter [Aureobasidium sp. EXF-8845]|nr:putative C4-dicarboxylate/malic acid transporter [Aureobasidium sp. EXF-8846]KAI4801284.1 putative C4-dicarboxylate/malic acid transporter [Aureobasidium sp. EXF-8845]